MAIANVGLTSNARARVIVTLEIPISDNWGGTCDVNQIVGQAKSSALGKLQELMRHGARIVGEPKVTMILVDANE